MAYAINNEQNVICSIISDQPLFYMDFEVEEENTDDDFFMPEFSDKNMNNHELSSLDGFYHGLEQEQEIEDAFRETAQDLSQTDTQNIADIKFLESTLEKSRLAQAYLEILKQFGGKLIYDAQLTGAYYDRESGNIYLNPHVNKANQALLAARELRKAWQHRNGTFINPLSFHPDQAILVNRAQVADTQVNMIRIAWELQLAGEKQIWQRLEDSSFSDLARAFARESYLDFRSLNNGVAQSSVFESWFLSERCRFEDKRLIQLMLIDYQGCVFEHKKMSESITAELIAGLGSMPFGKNYLSPYLDVILNDAIFTDVRDRSNANFLWFIKFERSFSQTEQELQTGMDNESQEKLAHNIHNQKERFGDHEKETNIISLPQGREQELSSKASGKCGEIIPFESRKV